MAQGTHSSNRPQLIEDLDVMITSRALKPGKVKLGGRFWTLKRDFTAAQILEFHSLINNSKTVEAFTMLVGTRDGQEFADLVLAQPTELITPALRRIYQLAGLLKRLDTASDNDQTEAGAADDADAEDTGEGESSAS
jgi:hypothetical protein